MDETLFITLCNWHDPGDLGGEQRPITGDHRYAQPLARGR
jgi:hypothetical protein